MAFVVGEAADTVVGKMGLYSSGDKSLPNQEKYLKPMYCWKGAELVVRFLTGCKWDPAPVSKLQEEHHGDILLFS